MLVAFWGSGLLRLWPFEVVAFWGCGLLGSGLLRWWPFELWPFGVAPRSLSCEEVVDGGNCPNNPSLWIIFRGKTTEVTLI